MSSGSLSNRERPSRRALIIDRNQEFTQLLVRTLDAVQLEAEVVDNGKDGLSSIAQRMPDIVFLSVEQPKKRGFALFTQVKGAARQIPIVIGSSTVPMNDLLLHQKLRLHADAYIDKRELEEVDLIKTLNELLELGLDTSEIAEAALRTMSAPATPPAEQANGPAAGLPQLAGDTIEQEIASAIDQLETSIDETLASGKETEEAAAEGAPTEPAQDPPADVERLQEELRQVRAELSNARHAASSSPFSDDYLELRRKADRSDQRIGRLEADIERLTNELVSSEAERAALEKKLKAAAARLVATEKDARAAGERGDALQRELDGERRKVETLEKQAAGSAASAEKLEREYQARLEKLEQRREEEVAVVEQRREDELAALEQRHARSLAAARRKAEELQREHRAWIEKADQEQAAAVAKAREEAQAELPRAIAEETRRLQAVHRKELADQLRGARDCINDLEKKLARRDAEHADELQAKDREAERARERAAEDRRQALEAADRQHRAQLESADNKRLSDLDEAAARHRAELGRVEEQWRAELESADARHREELKSAGERYRQRIEQLEQDRREAEAAAQTHAAKAARAYDQLLKEQQEAQRTRQELTDRIAELEAHHAAAPARPAATRTPPASSVADLPEVELFDDLIESVKEFEPQLDLQLPDGDDRTE